MISTGPALSARPMQLRDVPLEQLSSAKAPEADKVKELSRQFEAVLVRQILTEAGKPAFHSKYSDNSSASQIYQGMLNDKYADAISSSGMLGFARSMEKQLIHQVAPHDAPPISDTTPKAARARAAHIHDS